ncbi:MAG: NAD-dependent epimerase/dehydratase family protein [Gammaproteobacteria bacterium]|nr:NAD-dependent epimerase/dehydratase family protein [Gammaproteobacteria bacterium]
MRILVTGATGFVGQALCARLEQQGHELRRSTRQAPPQATAPGLIAIGELGPDTDWRLALQGCDLVIHLAARVHLMRDTSRDPLTAFRRANRQGSLNLAKQAAAAGVRRFIYLSTIKIHGEQTRFKAAEAHLPEPFRADDPAHPEDAYACSKWEAEEDLAAWARQSGMELVIIRPPLVHGPGVKGNLARMIQWLQRGWPLPLGRVDNRRSLVGLDNLIDLLLLCCEHPAAAGRRFLVADAEDLSTPELIRRMGSALGRPARLLPVPEPLLYLPARLAGKQGQLSRLLGSLQLDCRQTQEILGWTPRLTLDEGIRRMLEPKAPGKLR